MRGGTYPDYDPAVILYALRCKAANGNLTDTDRGDLDLLAVEAAMRQAEALERIASALERREATFL